MQTATLSEIRASSDLELLTILILVGLLVVKEIVARSERHYVRAIDRLVSVALIPVLAIFAFNLLARLIDLTR